MNKRWWIHGLLVLVLLVTYLPTGNLAAARTAPQSPTSFDCDTVTEIPVSECEALVALYNSTDGPNWTNNYGWLQTNTPCSWLGVTCHAGHVQELRLFSNQLSGTLPAEISNLIALQKLDLVYNQLNGAIPPELGNLEALQSLYLSDNQLSGSIPSELGNLAALQQLYIFNNQLSGSIPPELGNLTALESLILTNNQLSGSIPPELGNLTVLQHLYLFNNQLSGSIPPELGNLAVLRILNLFNNQLSGSIPLELGDLSALQELNLGSNWLSGEIPVELGSLTELLRLNLYNNGLLSGGIPATLGNLTKLQVLSLGYNNLSGLIPSELGNLTALQDLALLSNKLSGSIPPELGNLTELRYLWLQRNQLSGSIPPELGNLTALQRFYLHDNPQLSGALPETLTNIPVPPLDRFNFYNTQICEPEDGPVREWLDNIPHMSGTGEFCTTRKGMTWGVRAYNPTLDVSWMTCHGYPDGPCNASQGDTVCSAALPVLCLKVDGSSRPPYAVTPVPDGGMPDEFYHGWAEGTARLTAATPGNAFAHLSDVNAYCEAQFGPGYRVAEHHDGRWVSGMDQNNFYGSTWPIVTSSGGWGFYSPGQISDTSRFWVHINDQNANCWEGYTVPKGSIGNQVWADPDNDGNALLDGDDYPLPGIRMRLYDTQENLVRETLTSDNGKYLFSQLDYGTYTVVVDQTTLPSYLQGNVAYDPDGGADGLSLVTIDATNPHNWDQDFAFFIHQGPPTTLTAIYILQFDGYITSTAYLDAYYNETMLSLVQASLGHPEKTSIVLVDRSGDTPDAIFKIHDGIMTNITFQWPGMTPEVDSTDGVFLGNFVWWARTQYPAEHTTVSVVGHGLYAAPEMGEALRPINGLLRMLSSLLFPLPMHVGGNNPTWSDVNPEPGFFSIHTASEMLRIGSDDGNAPFSVVDLSMCYSASVEQFYALQDYTQMLTGAPNYTYYDPAMPGAGLAALDPTQSPQEMAVALISAYQDAIELPAVHPQVLIAVDTTHLDYLKERLDWLAYLLRVGLENPTTRAAYRAKILQAYRDSLHYDTTTCPPQDWELCPPDALVDIYSFMNQLRLQFGEFTPVGIAATEAVGAVQAVVVHKLQQNGVPWFGEHFWDFSAGAGLSIYAVFEGYLDESGNTVLNGISHWYTSTVSANNPHPYAFIASGVYGATWADVLHAYWVGTSITTEICLTDFPHILEIGDVAAVEVLFPIQGWAKVGTAIKPTVVFSTAETIHNPQLAITITHNGEVVFTDTVYLDYRAPGTYAVTANHAWTPTAIGPFSLTFYVDSSHQISETNKTNNSFTMDDYVQAVTPCARPDITATIVNGQQWFAAAQVPLNLAQTGDLCSPVTQMFARFYGFQPGENPATQVPVYLGDQTLPLSLPQTNYQLALPAGTPAGAIVVHLFPFSSLGGYGYPAEITFNYVPQDTAIDSNAEHFYRFTANAGEQIQVTCQTAQGNARVYVWEPDNPATAQTQLCGGSLSLTSWAGEYIVSVEGLENNTLYTLTATRGNAPLMLPQTTASPVEYVTRERPTFVAPLPELPMSIPTAEHKIYLPLVISQMP